MIKSHDINFATAEKFVHDNGGGRGIAKGAGVVGNGEGDCGLGMYKGAQI